MTLPTNMNFLLISSEENRKLFNYSEVVMRSFHCAAGKKKHVQLAERRFSVTCCFHHHGRWVLQCTTFQTNSAPQLSEQMR